MPAFARRRRKPPNTIKLQRYRTKAAQKAKRDRRMPEGMPKGAMAALKIPCENQP